MRRVLAFALFMTACGGSPAKKIPMPPPVEVKPKVVEETPPVEPDPIPEDAEAAKKRRVGEALARIPAVKAELSKLRALEFKQEVPAEYQTTEDFRTFVTAEVATELAPEKAKAMATAFHHIGFLADEVDLSATLTDAMVTQAAAYYDPKQKKFFVVMVPDDDAGLDMIASHELTHALQDQYFDLDAYMSPKQPLDDDAAYARKFVVEGEATLTMFGFVAGQNGATGFAVLKPMIQSAAQLTLDDFRGMTKSSAENLDKDLATSIDAIDSIPPLILVPMFDSYMKGALAVLTAFEAGGWDEVGKMYTTPPDSTEQMLHPDTKMYPTRDVPKQVTLPKLPGWTEVYGSTLGELQWRIYFLLWKKDVAETAAAGWDGDRWSVLADKKGNRVGLVVTTWDSEAEATEFADAYRATVATRFPANERTVTVEQKGETVYIVDGAADKKLIKKLVKGARVK